MVTVVIIRCRLTPDVVTLASSRAHILVTQEADHINILALVFTSLAVDARGGGLSGITVDVEDAGLVLGSPGLHLALLELRHAGGGSGADEGEQGSGGLHLCRSNLGLMRRMGMRKEPKSTNMRILTSIYILFWFSSSPLIHHYS